MNEKWLISGEVLPSLIDDVRECPAGWGLLVLVWKNSFSIKTGTNLLIAGFDFDFFRYDPVGDLEFSWLIRSERRTLDAMKIVWAEMCAKRRMFRHPLVSMEKEWLTKIFALQEDSLVFARYEGRDILMLGDERMFPILKCST